MKKYLVEDVAGTHTYLDGTQEPATGQTWTELPTNGTWLTRENLESVGVSKWAIDELFGDKP